jgi:hypothetical protein
MRLAVAGIVGWAIAQVGTWTVLVVFLPHDVRPSPLAYGMMLGAAALFGAAGGFAATAIAATRRPALVVGLVSFLFAMISTGAGGGNDPWWFRLGLVLLAFAAPVAGSRLRAGTP